MYFVRVQKFLPIGNWNIIFGTQIIKVASLSSFLEKVFCAAKTFSKNRGQHFNQNKAF
jgi:hypothetical protein